LIQFSGFGSLTDRFRERKLGPRTVGIVLAVLAEAVLLWLLLSLGRAGSSREETVTVVNLRARPPSAEPSTPDPAPEPAPAESEPSPAPAVEAMASPRAVPVPATPRPAPSPLRGAAE
jgi:hypothetical protein